MIAPLLLAAAVEMTTLGDGRTLVVERPARAAPRGVVLLIPGGDRTLRINADGSTSSTNFVIRTRDLVRAAGFATAYMDDPGELREAIAKLRAIARPVVILSTSRGTILAAETALKLGSDGPDLLVLTSPISSGADSLLGMNLRRISTPTLIVENANDTCRVSLPDGAAQVAQRLGPTATLVTAASSQATGRDCGPTSPHGYLGVESEVIGTVVDWIRAHTTT